MSGRFSTDKIQKEKPDLHEGSSLKFLPVPFTLWVCLAIFGICYLAMQTKNTELGRGDKRSPVTASTAAAGDPELGATLYKKHCQACHQPTGKGLGSAFPPLVGSEWVNGDPETISAIVLHGIQGEIEVKGTVFKGLMPTFKSKLTPEEIAAVTTYVRSSWGNSAGPVDTTTVEKILEKTSERTKPWKGGVELKEQSWK